MTVKVAAVNYSLPKPTYYCYILKAIACMTFNVT